jgi:hypothetical protein
MDITMYLFMGLSFPSRYYFSMTVLLAICGIMFFIKKPSVQYAICIFLLSVHFVAAVANIILFKATKEIISFEALAATRQVATLRDFIILDFGYMFTFSVILFVFIAVGILIFSLTGRNSRKFARVETNKYRRNVGFALATLAFAAYLTGIFNLTLPQVSLDVSDAYNNYTNDGFVYQTFSNRPRVLQEFGTYSYFWSNLTFLMGLKHEFVYDVPDETTEGFTFEQAVNQNVIMLQMESLEDSLINPIVMPNLYNFLYTEPSAENTVKFDGLRAVDRTSNAEYSTLAGVHLDGVDMNTMPLVTSPFALPQILSRTRHLDPENSYTSIKAFHNFYSYVYNRDRMFESAFGFDEFIALSSEPARASDMLNDKNYGSEIYVQNYNRNSDYLMFKSQVEKMTPEDEKFFSWILNISTHSPYYDVNLFDFYETSGKEILKPENINKLKKTYANLNSPDKSTREAVLSYLTGAYEYDRGLGLLFDRLRDPEFELLDKTTIVFYADHYNYMNPNLLAPTEDTATDENPVVCGAQGRPLAFYIYSPVFEGQFTDSPHVIKKFFNHYDIYATVCDILHIEINTKYTLGISAFKAQENIGFSINHDLIFGKNWASDSFFNFLPGSRLLDAREIADAKTRLSHIIAVMNNLRPLFRNDNFPEQAYYYISS